MEDGMILLDTSIVIEFFRKRNKEQSRFIKLRETFPHFAVSAVTEYEVRFGSRFETYDPWEHFFTRTVEVLSFDSAVVKTAVAIQQNLRRTNTQLDISDLFIAATAVCNGLRLATLNCKHFGRVAELCIV
ncbi:MAG: type II toxin-antitoxin system VapC family toxin [Thermoguttaceae bacterium]